MLPESVHHDPNTPDIAITWRPNRDRAHKRHRVTKNTIMILCLCSLFKGVFTVTRQWPKMVVTGLIGAGAGFAGNVLAPFAATTNIGAYRLGSASNLVRY